MAGFPFLSYSLGMEFSKPVLSINDQLKLLQSRGLLITNEDKAAHYLSCISYYRLSAYMRPFQIHNDINHTFKENITFDDVLRLYTFDRETRLLVLDSIEKIEIALRTQIIYHLCIDHGRNWFENPTIFKKDQHAKLIEDIDKEINRTNEVFIKEYKNKYTSPTRPPAWMTIEVTPIGLLSRIFSSLQDKLPAKKTIGSFWGIDSIVLQNWIYSICYVRNICAHHGRLWNRSLNPNIKIPKKCEDKWLSSTPNVNNKLYLFLAMKTYLLRRLSDKTEFVNKFQNLLHKYPQIDIKQMGFSDDWQKDSFWMCPM